jgi:hypothetical protein
MSMTRFPKLTMLCGLAAALTFYAGASRAEDVHVQTVTPKINVHTNIGSQVSGAGAGKMTVQNTNTLNNSDTVSQYGSDNGGVGSGKGGHGGHAPSGSMAPARP